MVLAPIHALSMHRGEGVIIDGTRITVLVEIYEMSVLHHG